MTEEIIIDGVDVAGCEHYTTMEDCDGIHDLCEQLDDYCSTKKNCYYKQLKRLEQENKELKVVKEQLKKWNDENLKRQDDMQLWIDLAEEQRRKYRSALEEIKTIINQSCDNCKYNKDGITCSIGDCGEGKLKIIENKINEVLK